MKKSIKDKLLLYIPLTFILITSFVAFKNAQINAYDSKPKNLSGSSIRAWPWEDIPHILEYSDAVITAEMKEQTISCGFKAGIFAVGETLWGKCPYDEIIIYNSFEFDHMKAGGEYLLFLDAMNLYAYPENSYSLTAKESCYTYKRKHLEGTSQLADTWLTKENNTLDKMRVFLSKIPSNYELYDKLPDSFATIKEMYDASANVAKVKVTDIYNENESVDIIRIKDSINYKGESLDENIGYLWPAYEKMQKSRTYYVFLDKDNLPVAREGSIIGMDDENWQECVDFLSDKAQ